MSVGRGAGGELMIMMIHLQLPKGNVQAWAVAISNRNNRGGGGCTPSTTDVNRSGGGWPAGFTSFNLRSVLRVMLLSASTHHRTARILSRRSLFRKEAVLSRLGCSASTEFHRQKTDDGQKQGHPMTSLPLTLLLQ
jgi:hypothetical protein